MQKRQKCFSRLKNKRNRFLEKNYLLSGKFRHLTLSPDEEFQSLF
jgi:hypothetical protein